MRSVEMCVTIWTCSANLSCMPLYSPVQGSYISFPPHPLEHGTAMAASIGAANGFRKGDLVNGKIRQSTLHTG